jgi:S1-C subfamily serine protease
MKMKNDMNSISNYIVPIMGQAQQGCGFFVGNYFITAGHVIEVSKMPLSVRFEGRDFILDKSKAIKICYSKKLTADDDVADFALFAVDGVNSPLKLARYKPIQGQELCCITYDTIVTKDETSGLPAIFSVKERIERVVATANVREETLGNFFACDTNPILKKGNSGSPLLDAENKVVGILHGGSYIPECCIFQNVQIISILID